MCICVRVGALEHKYGQLNGNNVLHVCEFGFSEQWGFRNVLIFCKVTRFGIPYIVLVYTETARGRGVKSPRVLNFGNRRRYSASSHVLCNPSRSFQAALATGNITPSHPLPDLRP
jgi:hypothetical protein